MTVNEVTPTTEEGDREALARILFIASDDFAFADRMARAWDAPGPYGRTRWYRYADAVIAAGFHRKATHDRKVAAEAWDAAVKAMRYEDGTPVELVSVVNPYRADRIEQGGQG